MLSIIIIYCLVFNWEVNMAATNGKMGIENAAFGSTWTVETTASFGTEDGHNSKGKNYNNVQMSVRMSTPGYSCLRIFAH